MTYFLSIKPAHDENPHIATTETDLCPHQSQTHLLPSLCEGPFKSSSLVTLFSAAWRHETSYVNDICCLNPQLLSVMALQTIYHGCTLYFFFLLPHGLTLI